MHIHWTCEAFGSWAALTKRLGRRAQLAMILDSLGVLGRWTAYFGTANIRELAEEPRNPPLDHSTKFT